MTKIQPKADTNLWTIPSQVQQATSQKRLHINTEIQNPHCPMVSIYFSCSVRQSICLCLGSRWPLWQLGKPALPLLREGLDQIGFGLSRNLQSCLQEFDRALWVRSGSR